jgi:hypothetical protein
MDGKGSKHAACRQRDRELQTPGMTSFGATMSRAEGYRSRRSSGDPLGCVVLPLTYTDRQRLLYSLGRLHEKTLMKYRTAVDEAGGPWRRWLPIPAQPSAQKIYLFSRKVNGFDKTNSFVLHTGSLRGPSLR